MADEGEKFVSRWSRLKREAREQADKPADQPETPANPEASPPELPPVDRLNFDSDYGAFFHPKVDEDTRRAALKRLFSDARFNVIDPLDIDIEDYSKLEPLSAAAVASLKQAQDILQWARERREAEARRESEGKVQIAGRDDAQPHPDSRAPDATEPQRLPEDSDEAPPLRSAHAKDAGESKA